MKKVVVFCIFCFHQFGYTQIKVNASLFGAIEAREMGPGTMSGRISAIEGVNENPKTLFIGTAGGGVWKSTNAGASFKSVFDKYCQSIGAIAIDQSNPKTIFVGTGESNMRNSVSIGVGLYKSTDEGENWTKIGLDSTEHISKIIIHPKNSDIIYVAAPGPLWSDSPHRGLYKSEDGGKTWNKILFIDNQTGCADILINSQNPDILYASTWQFRRKPYAFNSGGKGSGLYKSIDGGKNWTKITNGLPTGEFGRIAMAIAPSNPKKLIAIVESNNTGLYISEDGGDSWKSKSATMNVVSRPFYFACIAIDPKDEKRVYRPGFQFAYSDDGGYSFHDASNDGGWVHSDHHALWINPNNTNQLFLGTDGGVYISNDRGATFIFCHNLPVGQFYHVAVDNKKPFNIYGGLQDNGSWIAPSANAGGVGNADWKGIYWGDGFWTVPDPSDENIAFAEYQGGNAARIDLRTNKSNSIQPQQTEAEEKLRWNWNTPILVGQANKKNLYMASQYLYKSTDQGRNWKRISPDLTTNDPVKLKQEESGGVTADNTSAENHCTIFTGAESTFDENIIWIGTDDGNLQMTKDGGKNWINLSANYAKAGIPPHTWISSIELSRHNKNEVYVSFDNHMYGDHNTYLAKSLDGGQSWERIQHKDFTGFAHKIKQDIANPDLLFLGTEMGLFASLDKGINWFRMKNKIPEYALVRDIQIQENSKSLVIATHGRGIYVLDDISAMRNIDKQIFEKDIHLFDIPKIEIAENTFGGSTPSPGGWWAENPEEKYAIQYYLKDRLMTGEVEIQILDAEGKLIKSLPGTKRKGINKVIWDYRIKGPKTAEGGVKLDYAAFIGPMVMPGKYKVQLKVGDKLLSDDFDMVLKEKPDFTVEDKKVQYETTMKYYYMHEQLARVVDEINKNKKIIEENKDKIKSQKNKAIVEEYLKKMDELRFTLLASKNKSIFADERKLREELTETYALVAGDEQRPSNLSIDRVSVLQKKVDKAELDAKIIHDKYYTKMLDILKKEGISLPVKP